VNIRKSSILLSMALAIYYGFEVWIGWLVYNFSIMGVIIRLYFSMVTINILAVYAYSWIGEDFLDIEKVRKWLLESNEGKFLQIRKIIRKSRKLSFVALSILPCPMAGYFFFNGNGEKRLFEVVGLIGIGSIPCALVWGGGPSLIWNSNYRWQIIFCIVVMGVAVWTQKRIKNITVKPERR